MFFCISANVDDLLLRWNSAMIVKRRAGHTNLPIFGDIKGGFLTVNLPE